MIYYFSGTGNSRYMANSLAKRLGHDVKLIAETNPANEKFDEKDMGLVFPIYSWGVPPIVLNFIDNLPESFWQDFKESGKRIWTVMTYGDEAALAPEMLQKRLAKHGVKADYIRGFMMPNNYVLLPGFDVDSKELENAKLDDAPRNVDQAVREIERGKKGVHVTVGSMPWIKTKLVYPLFKKWGMFPSKWEATTDCIGCGICERVCPVKNIKMKDGRPTWGDDCTSCVACYHYCPKNAVQYGKMTKGKGQYHFPKDRE